MDHTPAWISRKFEQTVKEQYEEHQRSVFAHFQSLLLLVDGIFNKGRDFHKIMPPTLEEAIAIEQQRKMVQETFLSGAWWK